MDGKMYRVRRKHPIWSKLRGELVEFLYLTSYGEGLYVLEAMSDVVTGPIEIRCNTHGWAATGCGDVCGECADMARHEPLIGEGGYTIKVGGDPLYYRLIVNLHPEDVALIRELGYKPREEHGNMLLEIRLEKQDRIEWRDMDNG